MKKQILSTVAAMAVLVAAGAAQAGGPTKGSTGSNGISVNGIESMNALTQNGLNTSNAVNTDVPAVGARVIFIELPAAR